MIGTGDIIRRLNDVIALCDVEIAEQISARVDVEAENARLKDTLRETFSELARLENEQWRDRVYSPLR